MISRSLAAVLFFILPATLGAQTSTTVVVSPVPGNPTASATQLLNALSGITNDGSSIR